MFHLYTSACIYYCLIDCSDQYELRIVFNSVFFPFTLVPIDRRDEESINNEPIMRSNISFLKILTTHPNVMILESGKDRLLFQRRISYHDLKETIPRDIISNRIELNEGSVKID